MRILVFGAAGGSVRAIVAQALADGHQVTAFVRNRAQLAEAPGLNIVEGDATKPGDVAGAIRPGHDAIVVALGERPKPLDWVPGLRRAPPSRVCEIGTRNILAALPEAARTRLIVISAYGVGDTRALAPWYYRWYLRLFLGALMEDKERQEARLKASALAVLLLQPVALTDAPAAGTWLADSDGSIRRHQVSRQDLARFIAAELRAQWHLRGTIAFSG